jgi:hypothetical protein
MAATLYDVADFFKALEEQLPQVVSNLAVEIAIAVVDDLALITPADTGAAISNWQVTLDEPATDEIDAYAPSPSRYHADGTRRGSGVDPAITRAANAPLVLENAALILSDKQPGQDIYITNLVGTNKEPSAPYILDLDAGSSPQFIGDFLGREALVVEAALASATLIIK